MEQGKLFIVCKHTLVLYTIILVIGGLGCFGNVLAFIGFQKEKKESPITFLFKCLAIADTAFLVCFCSLMCTDAMLQCVDENYSQYYRCHKQAYLFYYGDAPMHMAHLTSVWITVLLGIIRFAAVCYPLRFKSTFTLTKVKRICAIALVFIVPFELFWLVVKDVEESDKVYSYKNETCVESVNRDDVAFMVYVFGFTFAIHILIPLITLTFITFKIIFALRARSSRRAEQSPHHKQTRSVSLILVFILIIFLINSIFHVVQMVLFQMNAYANTASQIIFFISRCLLAINSGINVIIYITLSKHYRTIMLAQLCAGKTN